MPVKERESFKLYYSIGEVAEMLDVNASLLRFWEKEFDIIKPQKNAKGNRIEVAQSAHPGQEDGKHETHQAECL